MCERRIRKMSEHVGYFEYGENDCPNLGYVEGSEKLLIIDGGNSKYNAKLFLEKIKNKRKNKKLLLFLTDYHWDHVCGAKFIPAKLVAGEGISEKIKEMQKRNWQKPSLVKMVKEDDISQWACDSISSEQLIRKEKLYFKEPDIVVNDKMMILLDNMTCIYEPIVSGHAETDYVLYVMEEKIVFIGDVLWPNIDSREEHWSYNYTNFKAMRDKLLSYDAQWYVEAHGEPISREDLELWMDKLLYLMEKGKEQNVENVSDLLEQLPEHLRDVEVSYANDIYEACLNLSDE